jgi:hypothetical protein
MTSSGRMMTGRGFFNRPQEREDLDICRFLRDDLICSTDISSTSVAWIIWN